MSRARDLSDYVSTGVSAAEFDQLDTTSGVPGVGNFLRGDKTWSATSEQLVHLETNTVTGTASVTFEEKLTDTYLTYLLIGNAVKPDIDNRRIDLLLGVGSAGSVTWTTADYYTYVQKVEGSSWGSVVDEAAQASAPIGGFGNQGSGVNEFSCFQTYIFNARSSGVRTMGTISASGFKYDANFIYSTGGFMNTDVEAHTSIKLSFSSSDVGQGIFSLYGIKNG